MFVIPRHRFDEGQRILRRKRCCLEEAIILPSLRIDPVSGAHGDPHALVDLGRCNLGVASRLAAALRGAGAGE
ncbi:hypothetical protein [Streptomyces sp. NPDC058295]|uniref:hypothetical protein n=1 Tax=Streptomyces sp. NPDC058295 TaxID=3346431 RepID=UPI0036E52C7F